MKMRIALAALAAVLMVLPMALGAQVKPVEARLVYFENNSKKFQVLDGNQASVAAEENMVLAVGWTIKTGKGDFAEVKLTHNGTIVKISPNTAFTVKALGNNKETPNVLSVAVGKIRTVAGKATGDQRYRVEGGAAVCGVSGTDFVFEVASYDEMLYVLNGLVSFFKDTSPDKLIPVGAGEMMSFEDFTVRGIPADKLEQLKYENEFKRLIAEDVEKSTDGGKNAFEAGKRDVWGKIKELLGMEIGAIDIEGVTWSKIVVQPKFRIGKMKVGLYLPLIYNGNMFDPEDWYHPNGNDEWSFGFDQVGLVDTVTDVVSDTFLKIRYFEWSDQRNPPFLKIGNLNDMTIGHGLIMRDFANDADFPAIRRVGLNFGFDLGKVGFEYMVNDAGSLLTIPLVFSDATYVPDVLTGGRLYFQPLDDGEKHDTRSIKDLAFGISLLADIGASSGFDNPVQTGEPIFFNPGIDIDVPIHEGKLFSIVAFADAAVMVPYFRHAPDLGALGLTEINPISAGFAWNAVYNPDADIGAGEVPFKNYGAAAGLFGNAWFVNWRLEYRYFTGVFKPAFYNTGYERSRGSYVVDVLNYLTNMADPSYNALTMGVYGEGGFTWEKICKLDIGYFWPWDASGTIPFAAMEDRLIAKFTLEPGVIPVVHLHGSVSYERTGFAQTLIAGGATLFDANTVVKAELVYPVAPTIDVALFYTTMALLDGDGNPIYDGNWLPKMNTNLTFETRVHF